MSSISTITVFTDLEPIREVTATVGRSIGFKSDVEQYAEVLEIRNHTYGGWQVLVDIRHGEYNRGPSWIMLNQCWNDDCADWLDNV
jgi:hypothetical protein